MKFALKTFLKDTSSLFRSRTTRETGLVFSGNLANKALTFAVHLVLIRALSVREFALFSVTVMALEVLVSLADLGLNLGLVRNYSLYAESAPDRARSVVRVILRAKVVWTFFLAMGVWVLSPSVCRHLLRKEELAPYIRLTAAGLFAPVLIYFVLAHLQAARLFLRYVFVSTFGRVLLLASTIFLAATGRLTLASALGVYLFVPFATALVGFLLSPRDYLRLESVEPGVVGEVFHFGKWVTLATLLVLAYMRLDVFMLTALSTEEQISIFVIAVRFALLLQVLTTALGTTLLPYVGRFRTAEECRAYLSSVRRLIAPVALGVGAVCLAAYPIVVIPSGQKGIAAVPVFRVLILAYGLGVIARPYSVLLYRLDRVDLMCLLNAIQLATCFVGNWFLIPRFGAMGSAAVAFLMRLVILVGMFVFVPHAVGWAAKSGRLETGAEPAEQAGEPAG